MGDKVRKNYSESAQLYQMEEAIRVIFNPDFNVWQVHKTNFDSWKQIRFERVGHQNSRDAFDFAMLYVKYFKYGLSDDEEEMIKTYYKYEFSEDDIAEHDEKMNKKS